MTKKTSYSPREGEAFRIRLSKDDLDRVRSMQQAMAADPIAAKVPSISTLIRYAIRCTYNDVRPGLLAMMQKDAR